MAKSKSGFPQTTLGRLTVVTSLVAIALSTFVIKNPQSLSQFAAKPQPVPSSIILNQSVNPPALGSTVTFSMIYPKNTKNPWVSLSCYLDQAKTNIVYGEGATAKQANYGMVLGGGSSLWLNNYPTSSVYCTAELGDLYWQGGKEYYNRLASTDFTALGK